MAQTTPKPGLIGDVSAGISAFREADGNIDFRVNPRVWLSDGRELHHVDGKWEIVPAENVDITYVKPIDFAIAMETYLGRRIHLRSVSFFGVDVRGGMVHLPGSAIHADFVHLNTERVRSLVQECRAFGEMKRCVYNVIATVRRSQYGEKPELADLTLDPPS